MHAFAVLCAFTVLNAANISNGGIITLNDPAANFIYNINQNSDGSVGMFSSSSPSTNGLPYSYGVPDPSGNALTFRVLNGLNFSSNSFKPSQPSQFVDGSMGVEIIAKPGKNISTISIDESGSYAFGINADATSTAKVSFLHPILTIEAINGVPLTTPYDVTSLVMNFIDPPPTTAGSKTIHPNSTNDWEGILSIDLNNTPFAGQNITKVSLLFDNRLETFCGPAENVSIDKKKIVITTTSTVPEPTVLIMLVIGVLGLGVWRRKN